ncbi:MAG: pentapeptide repeat-containing protein [Chloroflexi bacterium]|nr:pentapeptide repeat-containing protein [Chloroflexota bacterium]
MSGATLSGATLNGATLNGATLSGATLSGGVLPPHLWCGHPRRHRLPSIESKEGHGAAPGYAGAASRIATP